MAMRMPILLLLGFSAFAAPVSAQSAPLLDIPVSKLETAGTRNLRESSTILVPTVLLNIAADGSLFAVRQSAASEPPEYRFTVKGFDKEFLRGLAQRAQDDFVQQLRAKGLIVLTYADLKDHDAVLRLGRLKTKQTHLLPYRNDRFSAANYLIATPSDEQAFKAGNAGNAATFREVARELRASVIVPEYWINAPQVWGENAAGYKSAFKETNVAPGLDLYSAYFWLLNSDGAVGSLRLKDAVSNVAPSVGELRPAKAKPGKATYQLTIDSTAYAAAVLRATMSINKTAAEILKSVTRP
jgi:hypothetical protein